MLMRMVIVYISAVRKCETKNGNLSQLNPRTDRLSVRGSSGKHLPRVLALYEDTYIFHSTAATCALSPHGSPLFQVPEMRNALFTGPGALNACVPLASF